MNDNNEALTFQGSFIDHMNEVINLILLQILASANYNDSL